MNTFGRLSMFLSCLSDVHEVVVRGRVLGSLGDCAYGILSVEELPSFRCHLSEARVAFHTRVQQGKDKPVIMKALVELDGPRSMPFKVFMSQRKKWMIHDMYRAPGKIPWGTLVQGNGGLQKSADVALQCLILTGRPSAILERC